jgi:hypothetical protein
MDHTWEQDDARTRVRYRWKKQRWHAFDVVADGRAQDISAGSEEEFITEHYWGYTRLGPALTATYVVEHPRWQVYPIQHSTIDVDFGVLYGERFADLSLQEPRSVLLAEGSPIVVRDGERLV